MIDSGGPWAWIAEFRRRHQFAASTEIEALIVAARDQGREEGKHEAASVDLLAAELSRGYHGVSLQMRRGGTQWPKPWRAMQHRGEKYRDRETRSGNRLIAYGDSPVEALQSLQKITGKN